MRRRTLVSSQTEPAHRFGVVLENALAVGVTDPEVELRDSMALISGQTEPAHRFGIILRYATPTVVHVPEDVLHTGVALLSRQPVPPHGLVLVLENAIACGVHVTEDFHRPLASLRGGQTEPASRFLFVLENAITCGIHEPSMSCASALPCSASSAPSLKLSAYRWSCSSVSRVPTGKTHQRARQLGTHLLSRRPLRDCPVPGVQ